MYGGTGRAGLLAVALVACLSATLSACQEESAPSGAARQPAADTDGDPVRAAEYDTWQPTYRDVRAATASDVLELRQRVHRLSATSYTVRVPQMDLEIARSTEHVRVRIGGAWTGGYELHLDPRAAGEELLDIGPFVLCSLADDTCTEVDEDRESGGGPHLFNNGLDTLVFTAGTIVQVQEAAAGELGRTEPDGASTAVVDSPAGVLDCLVTGGRVAHHARLEGRSVDLDAQPFSVGRRPPLMTTCVDERGLVVLSLPALLAPVVPYTSFADGVPDGFDNHAEPVPYGTSPSPDSTTPDPSGSSGPDTVQEVLVAATAIDSGESLADALAAGRFELTAVPGADLLPGAVTSTSGLAGVATRDVAEGEQITADLFR